MGRTRAALAAAAIDHDSCQDENHAGDPEQMCDVLGHGAVMRLVTAGAAEVDEDVEDPRRHHHGQTDMGSPRHAWQVAQRPSDRFYHQHVLVIHRGLRPVKSIASFGM